MNRTETPVEALRGYLRQLTPNTRARLLAEIERLRQNGENFPGAEIIVAELSADRPDQPAEAQPADKLDPAGRHFFRVLDPYLTNRPPERANDGQIARVSLQPIWDWITRDLMASMARAYAGEIKQFLVGGRQRELDQAVQQFQNKAVKYLQGTLASQTGAEQARARLGKHGATAANFSDLLKMQRVLKARSELAGLEEELPVRIDKLENDRLERTRAAVDRVVAAQPDAMPFALMLILKRLVVPWQLLRLATKTTETKAAAEIAAAPYGFAMVLVLDRLEDAVDELRVTLRKQHIPRAKEILSDIYDTEYAIRVRVDLDDSAWGARLDAIMQMASDVLDTEVVNLPAGLNHVLRSRTLKHHQSLMGRLTYLGWKCRDAVTGAPAQIRDLLVRRRAAG